MTLSITLGIRLRFTGPPVPMRADMPGLVLHTTHQPGLVASGPLLGVASVRLHRRRGARALLAHVTLQRRRRVRVHAAPVPIAGGEAAMITQRENQSQEERQQ
eukprot:8463861-Pyramimonas_sp.AAC.3